MVQNLITQDRTFVYCARRLVTSLQELRRQSVFAFHVPQNHWICEKLSLFVRTTQTRLHVHVREHMIISIKTQYTYTYISLVVDLYINL